MILVAKHQVSKQMLEDFQLPPKDLIEEAKKEMKHEILSDLNDRIFIEEDKVMSDETQITFRAEFAVLQSSQLDIIFKALNTIKAFDPSTSKMIETIKSEIRDK